MLKFTSFVATVVACLLPTLAIVILTRVETTAQKLGLIAGFTALFSIGLIWLTDAGTSRVQIFAATAASVLHSPTNSYFTMLTNTLGSRLC